MSELLTIRGVKFRKKAFADMSFSEFKKRYEKQMPWKKIDPKLREKALKDDFEKLTGNKPGKREKKTSETTYQKSDNESLNEYNEAINTGDL